MFVTYTFVFERDARFSATMSPCDASNKRLSLTVLVRPHRKIDFRASRAVSQAPCIDQLSPAKVC